MRTSRRTFATTLATALFTTLAGTGAGLAGSSAPAAASRSCPLPIFGPGRQYHPTIDPAAFSAHVDNPMFPLTPGTTLIYTGTKDGKRALDVFATSRRTVKIGGVTTRVVQDRLYLNNVLEERTADYYAQDLCGNVWYFGEDTATLDRRGHVTSTDGSFRAGVAGAQPGVFMQAQPQVGRSFRQEWKPGQAEDVFKALRLSTGVQVPAGRFTHALKTRETTALEPGVVDNKYYVRGIGEVKEVTAKGPLEDLELVEVIR